MTPYLLVNAVLYVIFAAWCVLLPDKTSTSLGFGLLGGSGRSEYDTVYGGLQLGLGIFFALCAYRPELRSTGVLFAVCLYLPIFTLRVISFFRYEGIGTVTIATACLEAALTIWGAYLFMGGREVH